MRDEDAFGGGACLRRRRIAALGERLGSVDHVVATASARARGRVADLDRDAVRLSFDTKVIGPLMLAKHLAARRCTSTAANRSYGQGWLFEVQADPASLGQQLAALMDAGTYRGLAGA